MGERRGISELLVEREPRLTGKVAAWQEFGLGSDSGTQGRLHDSACAATSE